jgi:hypothetical protein
MDRSHIAWVVLLFVAATAAQLKRQDDPIS